MSDAPIIPLNPAAAERLAQILGLSPGTEFEPVSVTFGQATPIAKVNIILTSEQLGQLAALAMDNAVERFGDGP